MRVKVFFFAQLKEAVGTCECSMDLRPGATVGEAVRTLVHGTPSLQLLRGLPLLYSVNEDFVDENYKLKDNDRLGLLPPVAGG